MPESHAPGQSGTFPMRLDSSPTPGESALNVRADKIRNDIATRLRPVCRNLSDEEFSALIEQMTQVQLRGERRIP